MLYNSHLAWLALLHSSASIVYAASLPRTAQVLPRGNLGKYFALGDSYAAGIAAGNPTNTPDAFGTSPSTSFFLGPKCARFDQAYGIQLNGMLGGAQSFTHIACSGNTCANIVQNQIIDSDTDLATLSIGGNDLKFGDIVDLCVFQFSNIISNPGNPVNCDFVLKGTEAMLDDHNQFWNSLWNAIWKVTTTATKPSFHLYVTGYAQFWNANTDQCDSTTYVLYTNDPDNERQRMTKDLRNRMNQLLLKANSVIQDVVQNFRDNGEFRVSYVDIDAAFEGHRFCEDGNTEPQKQGEDRTNTWFFQWNTPVGNLDDVVGPTGPALLWAENYYLSLEGGKTLDSIYAPAPAIGSTNVVSSGIPVGIAKVFHPTTPGHTAIAQSILNAINEHSVQDLGPASG
jgi:lysophospholipase L1-like esterase